MWPADKVIVGKVKSWVTLQYHGLWAFYISMIIYHVEP